MINTPKEPPKEVLEYIKEKYWYRDGEIDSTHKKSIGYKHYRGKNKRPYIKIALSVGGQAYKLYRSHIVWFLVHGYWPVMEIDHLDRNSLNDKIDNLMQATRKEQQWNKDNSKIYRGMSIHYCGDKPRHKPYRVRNQLDGVSLGYYVNMEEAQEAIDMYLVGVRK